MMASPLWKRVLDRARSTEAHSRCQSNLVSVRRDGPPLVLSRTKRKLADPRVAQLEDQWISKVFPSSSNDHSRRSGSASGAQTFALEMSNAGRRNLRPLEIVNMQSGFGHPSCRSSPRCVHKSNYLRETQTGMEISWSAHDRRVFSTGSLNPEPFLNWLHSTSEELTSSVATVEKQTATDHLVTEKGEEEVLLPSTETLDSASLNLPKIENPTIDLIKKVCSVLDGQDWGPDTVKELEDAEVPFTPFLIQQIVQRMSSNVDLSWNFFQWARERAGRKLSMRAHIAMLDALGRAKNFEIMKQAFTLVLEDGHKKSAWPYNVALKWCSVDTVKEHNDGPRLIYVEAALYFWKKMKENSCKPTVVTYTRLIDLLARQGHHQEALEIFRQMLQANCPPNISTYNVLIHAFGVAGQLEVASSLFNKLSELGCKPNYSTYNTLIGLHVKAGKPEKALKFFDMMKAAGIDIGDDVYRALDMALTNDKILEVASLDETGSSGVGGKPTPSGSHTNVDLSLQDPAIGPSTGRTMNPNNLIRLLENGEPLSVEAKLERIKPAVHPRFVVQVLQRLKDPDTAMIFFNWAKKQPHCKYNEYSYCMMIKIIGRSRNIALLDGVLKEMQEQGIKMNSPIFTALITCYGRAKSMDGALKLFEQMKGSGCKPDIITYTSLIHLLAKHGNYEQAVKIFEEMQQAGIVPNTHTYSVVIYNLVKAGKVTEAVSLLNEMPGLGCQPSPITFATIIDHCAKEGQLTIAKNAYLQMEEQGVKPLRTTITVLAEAYRKAEMTEDADKILEKFRHRRFWDETFKSSTERVAKELLLIDLVKHEPEMQSGSRLIGEGRE